MIGFTSSIQGADARVPQFNGPANIMWDGTYLWVGNRGTYGQDPDERNKLLWVVDIKSNPPRTIAKIDLSPYDANFNTVRNVRLSSNGQYVYVCLGGQGGVASRCLIISRTTYAVIGNAQMSTALIGTPTGYAGGRAVDALDDLWVVNSNQARENGIERFSLAAVLANGTSPTTSAQLVSLSLHIDEINLFAGYIWGCAGDWGNKCMRMNPADGSYTVYAPPSPSIIWGFTAIAGGLWAGNFGNQVYRFDPNNFGSPSFLTDSITLPPPTTNGSCTNFNTFAFDGTYVWHAIGSEGTGTGARATHMYKLTTTAGSVSVAASVIVTRAPFSTTAGSTQLIFDGQYVWGGQRFMTVHENSPGPELVGSLVKIDPTPGAEKQILNWPSGGNITPNTSIY
jgi:hypothetical protein